jgi:type III pantothenate kinase
MSLLLIDAGNTQVKLVRWNDDISWPDFSANGFFPGEAAGGPSFAGALPTQLIQDPQAFSSRFLDLINDPDSPAVLVSVVPEVEQILKGILPNLQVVGHGDEYPFPHELQEAGTVGPDRICNMAAAVSAGLDRALVVDAGTATTFDLLLDGVFKGGLIAPGMAFAAQQLARHGALLEEVSFEVREAVVGRNTQEAMKGGAWLTGCGGVQWTIARLMESYGSVPVILTGGLASHLISDQRYHDPFWTIRGASALAGFHKPEAR